MPSRLNKKGKTVGQKAKSFSHKIFFFIFFLGFFGASCLITVAAFKSIKTSLQLSSFKETTGTVTHSKMETRTSRSSSGRHGSSTSTSYSADVKYSYNVQNNDYQGDSFSPFHLSGSQKAAQELLDQYPVGKRVVVYYNLDKPEQAFLTNKITCEVLFLPFMAMPFASVTLVMFFMVLFSIPYLTDRYQAKLEELCFYAAAIFIASMFTSIITIISIFLLKNIFFCLVLAACVFFPIFVFFYRKKEKLLKKVIEKTREQR